MQSILLLMLRGYRSNQVFRYRGAIALGVLMGLMVPAIAGCGSIAPDRAQAEIARASEEESAIAVEAVTVEPGELEARIEYTGTTEPRREVSLRSQVEGQLLSLQVDVGDAVRSGQTLAQLDDAVLLATVNQARAELAALQSEVAQAEAEVSDAQAQVEQARVQFQQASADADRLQQLLAEQAIAQQAADQAMTAKLSAEQVLRSAEERVRTREQAVIAARGRVSAQAAVLAQAQERLAFTTLTAPFSGVVLEKLTDPGNLIQPGNEVLRLGDFSAVKVMVEVSELQLGNLQLGQPAQVSLDAFPQQEFSGSITRIAPVADPTARLVPIEVTINNPEGRLGSGLLARVRFSAPGQTRLVIPEDALTLGETEAENQVFVVEGDGEAATAIARTVQVGDRRNGRVEILAGLESGERLIVQSGAPLSDGLSVRLSLLSDTAPQ